MNKSKYLEKCLKLLNREQFVRLIEDPTKNNERKEFLVEFLAKSSQI